MGEDMSRRATSASCLAVSVLLTGPVTLENTSERILFSLAAFLATYLIAKTSSPGGPTSYAITDQAIAVDREPSPAMPWGANMEVTMASPARTS